MNKILSLALILLIMSLGSKMLGVEAYQYQIDGFYYNILSPSKQTCEITHNGIGDGEDYPDGTAYSGIVEIPASVVIDSIEYQVVSINAQAFAMCKQLTYVLVPEGVEQIEDNAFYGCNNLCSIILPKGLKSIGQFAFRDCYYLNPIEIPSTVTSIGNSAFSYCTTLTSITIPESVTQINSYTFHGCTYLSEVNLSETLVSLGPNAFSECTSLTSIHLPNGLKSIGRGAFAECLNLTEISLPEGITTIENYTFRECESLESIGISSSIRSIGDYAFSGCCSLVDVKLAEGLTSIGEYAFSYCNLLPALTLPSTLQSLGEGAFIECSSLHQIKIPQGINAIPDFTFSYCESLSSISIPRSVSSIGEEAFAGCENLTDVYNHAVIPQDLDSLTFAIYGTLHVVENHISTFAEAELWDQFQIVDDLPYVRVSSIKLWQDSVQCNITDVVQARARCYPDDATYDGVAWSSSDPTIVFIDANTGQFVGARSGVATITAKAIDDSGVSASAVVTVGDGTLPEPETDRQCATPTIGFKDGELVFDSETIGAEFHCSIHDQDAMNDVKTGHYLPLNATLEISVYATAEGYLPSETAYATLHWLNKPYEESDTPVIFADKRPIFCTVNNGTVTLQGLDAGESVTLHTANGTYLGTTTARKDGLTIPLNGYKGTIIIITISDQTIKVLIQ